MIDKSTGSTGPDALKATLHAFKPIGDNVDVTVRLKNSASRALHYISDIRAIRYDPTTRTLTISFSDQGRDPLPSTITKVPQFRFVEPQSEVEINHRIPDRIVKFSRTAPPGKIAFETHSFADMEHVVVEVGWADVPFYKDTRKTRAKEQRHPSTRWEQHQARATMRLSPTRQR